MSSRMSTAALPRDTLAAALLLHMLELYQERALGHVRVEGMRLWASGPVEPAQERLW